jgi:orotate phosphoribosyltransferase
MTERSAARDRLIELVRRRSFSRGQETKLVSGRSSNFYFNMKPSMLDPEAGI